MSPTKYKIELNKSHRWNFDCSDVYPIEDGKITESI